MNFFGKQEAYIHGGRKRTGLDPKDFVRLMEDMGACEIIINCIEKDGTMNGYDIKLIKKISDSVTIPVVALGGAGKLIHFKEAVNEGHASAVTAGNMFVYHGPHKAVLINFPSQKILNSLFLNIDYENTD